MRAMSPDIIICDEVGTREEIEAIEYGLNSGVKFILTVHASSYEELKRKKQIEQLLDTGEFSKIVLLRSGRIPGITEKIIDCGVLLDEIHRGHSSWSCGGDDRTDFCSAAQETHKAFDGDTAVYFRR